MGILSRFESAMEKGVQGTFAKVFRSSLKPVDITSAVRKRMEEDVQEFARDHIVAPNRFVVSVSRTDYKKLEDLGLEAIASEIENTALQYAQENDYSLLGPVSVEFELGADELTGQLEISAQLERGPVAPAVSQAASTDHPIIEIEGERWLLTQPVTVIGRSVEADITIADSGISRKHLELRKTPDGVIATDLGSTNGLFVEGYKVDAATLVDGNQLVIGRTRILFRTSDEVY
ncbi:DUF3662 domain-containing protein [Gleimia sp. 6138-11-ORH1]|uniref:FhaA domain-containing protein n=1 Tax=Gleimia sp. 6138-11-ORH1 TaxID=2973937 RepID=UPI002167AC31|nr:DUF3662 and FHA domain-containing protein [Gleimia sp. 6138-11-ORH1]MCS4485106.1 DUF3662 domain-containing protein [Gleimia sp. 6138-11-ORH1]